MMKRLLATTFLLALFPSVVLHADNYSVSFAPAHHNVVRTTTPPVIDGVMSDDEWGSSQKTECSRSDPEVDVCNVADGWVNLNANTSDSHNLRFQMLWDDDNLYILGRSDYVKRQGQGVDGYVPGIETEDVTGAPNDPDFDGTGYAANFFFDPNKDDERVWDPEIPVLANEVDGYQISWDIHEGFASRQPTPDRPDQSLRDPLDPSGNSLNDYFGGMRMEAHVNSPFGNQGAWDLESDGPNGDYRDDAFPGLQFAQYAYNEDNEETEEEEMPGAIWEWAIPWEIFNATDPDRLVSAAEAAARPEMVLDIRQFVIVENPDTGELERILNPDFDMMVENKGQIPGFEAFIGNAGEPDMRFADDDSPSYSENGLYAPEGPKAGDIWGFETSIVTNDFQNPLPSWSEPIGGDPTRGGSFGLWGTTGHGQLEFLPEGKDGSGNNGTDTCEIPDGVLLGDLDESDSVGFADFLILSGNFGKEEVGYAGGDIDCSGDVAFADFLVLSGSFGKSISGAASVPEPQCTPLLAALAFFAFASRRKQRTA